MKVEEAIRGVVEALKKVAGDTSHLGEVRVSACVALLRAIEIRCELSTGDLDKEV